MKSTIITVYNSHNFGSYLQAKQLYVTLKQYSEPVFYDSNTRKIYKLLYRKCQKVIKNRLVFADIFKGVFFEIVEAVNTKRCWRSLPSVKKIDSKSDVYFLGSDEIWNIRRDICRIPVYWGAGLDGYKVAYAPSVNNATIEDIKEYPDFVNYLKDINKISARDVHSQETISYFIGCMPELVLDPTMLAEPEKIDFDFNEPYIAVYVFGETLKKDDIQAIKKFSEQTKMPLISAGQYISWCDLSVHSREGNPFYIFEKAAFVITNTFHGTAYAINYNCQFAAFAEGKKKIIELLDQFGLINRCVDTFSTLEYLYNKEINYTLTNDILRKLRIDSTQYIEESISMYDFSVRGNEICLVLK